ncbi:recombinase family protein [Microbacterium sp. A8/3-1]|uniref:Recombinase family protein n=1 Tax=Microbacterium sp. A8/3-1 TaxID=3160749 RepID=A0AAU7VWX4_9MICO
MNAKRAGIYARISKKDKQVPKVENQIAMLRQIAEDEGWTVDDAHVFHDDGIAASGKAIDDTTLENRPGARACLDAIRDHDFDVLLAVEGERLARTYLDGLVWIQASSVGGVTWYLDTDGPLDPSTPAGEETAVSIFASGRREGRIRSARQKRRYDRERAEGTPLWGTRPFGYEDDRITLRPAEADLIRQATDDYLAGRKSMIQLAQDWTKLGMLTDGMRRERTGRDGIKKKARPYWTATTVHRVLTRDRNAGILTHNGLRLPASRIQPIITEEELEALKGKVKTGTPMGARAQTLLGGILRCECGAPMHGTISYSQRKGGPRYEYRHYKCSQTIYDKTQKHSSIAAPLVDDELETLILRDVKEGRVRSPKGTDHTAALKALSARLKANREAIDDLAESIADHDLKGIRAQLRGSLKAREAEKEQLLSERDAILADAGQSGDLTTFFEEVEALGELTSKEQVLEWVDRFGTIWDNVPLETKQALIRSRYRPVVKRGGRGFDRVELNPVHSSTSSP